MSDDRWLFHPTSDGGGVLSLDDRTILFIVPYEPGHVYNTGHLIAKLLSSWSAYNDKPLKYEGQP